MKKKTWKMLHANEMFRMKNQEGESVMKRKLQKLKEKQLNKQDILMDVIPRIFFFNAISIYIYIFQNLKKADSWLWILFFTEQKNFNK